MNNEMFDELVESMKEAVSISKGEAEPSRVFSYSPMNIKEIREKHNDPVYQTLIDETVFWATRKAQLEAVFAGLKEEAARCKGAEEAARCRDS